MTNDRMVAERPHRDLSTFKPHEEVWETILDDDDRILLDQALDSLNQRWNDWQPGEIPPDLTSVFNHTDYSLLRRTADLQEEFLRGLLHEDRNARKRHNISIDKSDWSNWFPTFQSIIDEVYEGTMTEPQPCDPLADAAEVEALFHDQIGVYSLSKQRIASGGFSDVYKGYDTSKNPEELVAIKILKPKRDSSKAELVLANLREARSQAQFRENQHIVKILYYWPPLSEAASADDLLAMVDDGNERKRPMIVMEYLPRSLDDLIKSGELQDEYLRIAKVAARVAQALQTIHRHKLIHRDLKPGNILLDDADIPKLSDFGLAVHDQGVQIGFDGGTLPYCSPEQIMGNPDLDARSDIWSLGAVLFQMLNDERPFESAASDLAAWQSMITSDNPLSWNPNVPAELKQICGKCLQQGPDNRYQTAQEVGDVLQAWVDDQQHDTSEYLRALVKDCRYMNLGGLQKQKTMQLSIDELYIPLTIAQSGLDENEVEKAELDRYKLQDRRTDLKDALEHRLLVVVGKPGQGKTTFTRLVAFLLAETLLGNKPNAAKQRLGFDSTPFPIRISIADLCKHIQRCVSKGRGPDDTGTWKWIIDFLANRNENYEWGLDEDFFRKQFKKGTLLLDGLDEAPDEAFREQVSKIIMSACNSKHLQATRFVVTTRPAAYRGDVVLPTRPPADHEQSAESTFVEAHITPLNDTDIDGFLSNWANALRRYEPQKADGVERDLRVALRSRPEIKKLARNPLMLTALAIVRYNQNVIPQQRAELYELLIEWLARSRERSSQAAEWQVFRNNLQDLALFMQDPTDEPGRQKTIGRGIAAEVLAHKFARGRRVCGTRWSDCQ